MKVLLLCLHPDPESQYCSSIPTDFCHYVGAISLTNSEKMKALTHHFKPPKDYHFPVRLEYGKQRSFRFAWLEEYKWLVYSPAHNGAFCKFSVLFGHESNENNATKLDRLIKSLVDFWTTANQKFREHETKSHVHKTAMLKATSFMRIMQNETESIGQQLNSAVTAQVKENRKKTIFYHQNNFILW